MGGPKQRLLTRLLLKYPSLGGHLPSDTLTLTVTAAFIPHSQYYLTSFLISPSHPPLQRRRQNMIISQLHIYANSSPNYVPAYFTQHAFARVELGTLSSPRYVAPVPVGSLNCLRVRQPKRNLVDLPGTSNHDSSEVRQDHTQGLYGIFSA